MASDISEPLAGNYFVSAYPPFSCWKKEHLPALQQKLATHTQGAILPFGVYVHLPFCVERCAYCYYLSYAGKSRPQMDAYLDALRRELSAYSQQAYFKNRRLDFVYFGGGTPSTLSTRQIRRLLNAMRAIFPWTAVREATFECSPKTVTKPKLHALKEAGITRISLGIQQLNDEVLKKNDRVHLVRDIRRAYSLIQQIGFHTVNIDLMAGLVGETDASFFESLERVIEMSPESITIYQLEMPFNTPLFRNFRHGNIGNSLASWETKRARLAQAYMRLTEQGYHLRSAYTAVRDSGHEPFVYQEAQYRGVDLLGVGVSAFSYLDGIHHQNLTSLETYLEQLKQDRIPYERAYVLTKDERMIREFILQLKLGKVNRNQFIQKFDVDIFERFDNTIYEFIRQNLIRRTDEGLRLTRTGLLQVDRMLSQFYLPEHQDIRYS